MRSASWGTVSVATAGSKPSSTSAATASAAPDTASAPSRAIAAGSSATTTAPRMGIRRRSESISEAVGVPDLPADRLDGGPACLP